LALAAVTPEMPTEMPLIEEYALSLVSSKAEVPQV
jgi:hypothetical protein